MYISQYKTGFRYTSDTMFLWSFALDFIKKGRLLEVGGGSGALGLLLARERGLELTIVEKEPRMAHLCSLNAANNNISAKVICEEFARHSDIVAKNSDERFDYIVSNPPFYSTSAQKSANDSFLSSRYSDSLPLELFLQQSKKLLKPQGEIIFCYDARELQAIISETAKLKSAALSHIRFVHAKADKAAKLALFRIKNSSRARAEILPPLIVMRDNDYTPQVREIFQAANCKSVDIKEY
ncbi:MAG TPA: methyltransferase [Campylobacterales bacterium]|nr:methyltransferase [Campylobacterales bacterium]